MPKLFPLNYKFEAYTCTVESAYKDVIREGNLIIIVEALF
jgi:hypothetical protein